MFDTEGRNALINKFANNSIRIQKANNTPNITDYKEQYENLLEQSRSYSERLIKLISTDGIFYDVRNEDQISSTLEKILSEFTQNSILPQVLGAGDIYMFFLMTKSLRQQIKNITYSKGNGEIEKIPDEYWNQIFDYYLSLAN